MSLTVDSECRLRVNFRRLVEECVLDGGLADVTLHEDGRLVLFLGIRQFVDDVEGRWVELIFLLLLWVSGRSVTLPWCVHFIYNLFGHIYV